MKKMIGMKNKSINQVSIINGEDGPTSVFIFGEAQKQSLKIRIRNAIYQSRRKRIEQRIAATRIPLRKWCNTQRFIMI